jgi:hypothetical protein
MKKYVKITALTVIAFLSAFTSGAQKLPAGVALRVVIIRHGEKPDRGDNLSCKGLNRALSLPAILDTVTGKPKHTYVPTIKVGKKTSSDRMFQTVTPFAVQQNLDINSNYKETDSTGAANDVLTKKGVVLMVWEHSNIPPLARALGVPGVLSWDKKDFDSIWIIDFESTKKGMKFKNFTIKQENIKPSDTCPWYFAVKD